jgi:hypothetical protein
MIGHLRFAMIEFRDELPAQLARWYKQLRRQLEAFNHAPGSKTKLLLFFLAMRPCPYAAEASHNGNRADETGAPTIQGVASMSPREGANAKRADKPQKRLADRSVRHPKPSLPLRGARCP